MLRRSYGNHRLPKRGSAFIVSYARRIVKIRWCDDDSAAWFAILGADDTSRGTRQEPSVARTAALENAGIAYAVIGGNAVAAWVGRVDQSAVRFTQDVDLLILRSDLEATKAAFEPAGFIYRHVASVDLFLDGPDAKARDAVHVIFAGERVRPDYALPAPNIDESEPTETFRVFASTCCAHETDVVPRQGPHSSPRLDQRGTR